MEKSVEVASTTNAGVITTTTDHDFSVGDFVTYVHSGDSSEQIIGLESGRTYRVSAADPDARTFSLTDVDSGAITYGSGGQGDGTGSKFFLNSLGNAPSVGIVGGTAAPSEVLGAEELEIYGYVGKETAKFKNGATARDIAVAVNSVESKTGVVASASTHARLTLTPDDSADAFTVVSFDLYGMN